MITGFEDITYELSDYEMSLVPVMVKGFQNHKIDNPIKAPEIIRAMKEKGYKLSEPRLRKICNYIRSNAVLPLIATSNGYYVSHDKTEIQKQIESLKERARSIFQCAAGMEKFINASST